MSSTLTRPRPFGRRRKTYFYGVASLVLAAHVVIGGMIYVMPETTAGDAPELAEMGIDLVEFAPAPGGEIGARPVDLVEREVRSDQPAEPIAETPLDFAPVGEPQAVSPTAEPIGPTVTELPALVVEEKTPPVVASKKPAAASSASKGTRTVKRRTASRTRPRRSEPTKKRATPKPPAPQPIPRAIPTGRRSEPERTGLLDRLRDRRDRDKD